MHTLRHRSHRAGIGGFRPQVESLESRLCLSVTVSTVSFHGENILRIVGDDAANTVNISDDGNGNVQVTDGGGATVGSGADISAIKFFGNDGTDTVNYALSAALATKRSLYIDLGSGGDGSAILDLGAGFEADFKAYVEGSANDDTISVTVGDVTGAHVKLDFNGRGGDDNISVLGAGSVVITGEPDMAATAAGRGRFGLGGLGGFGRFSGFGPHGGASLDIDLEGGSDDDTIMTTLAADVAGKLNLRTLGGGGVDTLVTNLDIDAASTGKVKVTSAGGRDVDNVTLNVIGDTTALASLKAAIVDLAEEDTITNTDNVEVILDYAFHGHGFGGLGGLFDYCDE